MSGRVTDYDSLSLTGNIDTDIKLFKDNTILVQYMNNQDFRKDREETLIGKLAKRNTL